MTRRAIGCPVLGCGTQLQGVTLADGPYAGELSLISGVAMHLRIVHGYEGPDAIERAESWTGERLSSEPAPRQDQE